MTSHKNAMLVRLSISQWYNKVADKKISQEVNEKYGVADGFDDYYIKQLLPKEAMISVNKTIGRIRTAHYNMTMPWQDGGMRILSSQMYFEYTNRMRGLKDEFERNVEEFLSNYHQSKEKARESKKALYDESNYPSKEILRKLFEIRTAFYPLPEAGDFRLDLDEEDVKEIVKEAQADYEVVMGNCTVFLRDKLELLLESFYKATSTKRKFHESTVNNLYEFANMLPSLNISKDEDLAYFGEYIITNLTPHSTDSIKSNEELRNVVAKIAKDILDELKAKKEG